MGHFPPEALLRASLYYSGTSSTHVIVKPRSLRMPSSRLQTTPCTLSLRPCSSQAFCTAGILATLMTCWRTLSSTRVFYFWVWFPMRDSRNLLLSSRTWLSQDSRGPKSFCWKAALTPPQPQCPVTMMSSTLRYSTAYWTTANTLMSEGGTMLATLRCTNTSPGLRPMISLAGTRESAHPIHKYLGLCTLTSLLKQSGSCWTQLLAHILLFFIMVLKLSILPSSSASSRSCISARFTALLSLVLSSLSMDLGVLIIIQ